VFKLPEDVKNKYEFVTLASKRAEQLQQGALPRVDVATNKLTVMAQAEVARGVVGVLDPNAETAATVEEEEEE
jgi:DNA-directed RNA polymerase subunit K/omega